MRKSTVFGLGCLLGMFLTAVITLYAMHRMSGMTAEYRKITESQQQNYQKLEGLYKQCSEQFEQRTLLYDLKPDEGLPVLGGILELRPGEKLNQSGRSTARWFIPAKITPILYGGHVQGAAFAWYDPRTKKWEGPFIPEVSQ